MNNESGDQVQTISVWKIVLATALCMLLLMILAVVLINSITGNNWPFDQFPKPTAASNEPNTDPTGSTEANLGGPEDLGMSIEGLTDIALYSGDADKAIASADTVIAQLGDYSLNNSLLQVFYYMELGVFVSEVGQNGYDLSSYGLDITKPFNEQLIDGFTVSWEQYFLHNALLSWWRYVSVNRMADETGFQIPAEERASLDAVSSQLEEEAKAEGFENADALIKDRLGPACDLEDYLTYMELTVRGDLYYSDFLTDYEPTEEEVRGFFEANADYYGYYYGITADTGKTATVRHVLLVPEGATTDSSTGYVVATDEQWAAGLTAAQTMLNSWVASGAKEDDFAALANEHSTDGGSNTKGGLYEGVFEGQMVENFDVWVFDETRKTGDYGVVRTEFGYHLMYYVSQSEKEAWYDIAYEDTIEYGYGFTLMVTEIMESEELAPALSKIVLSDISGEVAEDGTETPTEATE